jgi:transcriptional regulator with XRE-family HTH domain
MATKKNKEEIAGPSLARIGEEMRRLRKAKYPNYEKFAYEHGFNRVQYGRYENGSDFRMSTFLKVLKALQVSPEEFFSGIK